MKLGILTNVVCNLSLEEALDYFKSMGIEMVEIGCGGTPGIHHCDPDRLLENEEEMEAFRQIIAKSGMGISAFSCHGNPLHPVKEIRERYIHIMKNAVLRLKKWVLIQSVVFQDVLAARKKPSLLSGVQQSGHLIRCFPISGSGKRLLFHFGKNLLPLQKNIM